MRGAGVEPEGMMAKKTASKTRGPRPKEPHKTPRRFSSRQLLVIGGIVVTLGLGALLMIVMPRATPAISTEPFPEPAQEIRAGIDA